MSVSNKPTDSLLSDTKVKSSLLHFKIHWYIELIKFYIRYPYHRIFHIPKTNLWDESSPFTLASLKGAIYCKCGYCMDLGYAYGNHCEGCYNRTIDII